MRRPDSFRSRDNDWDSMMTPMIDVVFLLLVFFVWTFSTEVVEYIIPSQMSYESGNRQTTQVEPLPKQDFDDVVIKIGWNGSQPIWTVNDSAS